MELFRGTYATELSMGWADPWVGLGWVGLGRDFQFLVGLVGFGPL